MNLDIVVKEIHKRGIQLWVDNNELRFRAPAGAMTPDIKAAIVSHKSALLTRLTQSASQRTPVILQADEAQRYAPFPLTEMQMAYLVGRTSAWSYGKVAPYYYTEIAAKGLQPAQLQAAMQRLLEHHDMLRAVITLDGMQRVVDPVPQFALKIFDLRSSSTEEIDTHFTTLRTQLSHQVLNPHTWPLFTLCLTRTSENDYRIHFGLDLLFCDAYSALLFCQQLYSLYTQPDMPLPETKVYFRDWVLHLLQQRHKPTYQQSQAYWTQRIEEMPTTSVRLPLLHNETLAKPRFQRWRHELAVERWQLLKTIATRHRLTPSGFLLSLFAEVLAHFTRDQRYLLNLTVFNRPTQYADIGAVIGDFTSTLVIEVDLSAPTFLARAQQLQKRLWQDLEHASVPGVTVLRELSQRNRQTTIIPVVFSSGLYNDSLQNGDASQLLAEFGPTLYSISQTPQVVLDHQVFEQYGRLCFNWDALEALFPAGFLDHMFTTYRQALTYLAEHTDWQEVQLPLPPATDWTVQQSTSRQKTALQSLPEIHSLPTNSVSATSANEKIITDIICKLLHLPEISVTQNFFEVGATSLLLVQAQRLISEAFEQEISVLTLFEYPTVRSLAAQLGTTQQSDHAVEIGKARANRRRMALRGSKQAR